MPSVVPRAALPPRQSRSGGLRRGGGARRPPSAPADAAPPRTLLFCKPYDVLCSFTDTGGGGAPRATLKDFVSVPHVYAAGRLDRDSEGLLVLTSSGALQSCLAEPRHKLPKLYWAQVEGAPSAQQLAALRAGVTLSDGPTAPLERDDVQLLADGPPLALWPREPPIRHRLAVPTAWLQLRLREGRNRQVRRMTAAVGLPTLRLVRAAVGPWTLGAMQPGEWRELPRGDWEALLQDQSSNA